MRAFVISGLREKMVGDPEQEPRANPDRDFLVPSRSPRQKVETTG